MQPIRILVADDDRDSRTILTRYLQLQGYTILPATTGRAAIAAAQATPIDLILMDLNMPELTGWEATAQLKADPRTAPIPIIAITAHGTGPLVERARAAGVAAVVAKPIDLAVLLDVLRSCLSQA